jgi:hypothetical protein
MIFAIVPAKQNDLPQQHMTIFEPDYRVHCAASRCRRLLRLPVAVVAMLLAAHAAMAGSILDYIRNYDLNDYALGVAYSFGQKPYLDGGNSGFAYPYLTSFRHIAFTDDWLILSGGDVGARWVSDSGLILGGVGRIKTHGTGDTDVGDVLEIDVRKWTVEVAPLVGWRRWPVHFEYKHYWEVFNRHGGSTGELEASFPMEFDWGYLVPAAALIRNDATHNRYYYGVEETPLLPEREAYVPGASLNPKLSLEWGFAIREKWLLSGSVGHEWLDTAITDSPIVGRETLWSANVGVAYNADIFQAREFDGDRFSLPRFEFRAGIFRDSIDSKVIRRPVDGGPSEEIDVEDLLGITERTDVWQVDAIWRLGDFHRLEFGHFQLSRDSQAVLQQDITIGDHFFPEGTEVATRADTRTTRIAYGFSLMNDAQKELGVMAGIHITKYESEILSIGTGDSEKARVSTPLPVVGAYGSVALGSKTTLGARLHMFRMEFDHYEGSLNYIYLGVHHSFSDQLGAGIGYNYYAMNLDSSEGDLRGSLRLRHRGPLVYGSIYF